MERILLLEIKAKGRLTLLDATKQIEIEIEIEISAWYMLHGDGFDMPHTPLPQTQNPNNQKSFPQKTIKEANFSVVRI